MVATDDFSHSGFKYVVWDSEGYWRAEVLLQSNYPPTVEQSLQAWAKSPEHYKVLTHPGIQFYGWATGGPSAGGWYYTAMEVEASP